MQPGQNVKINVLVLLFAEKELEELHELLELKQQLLESLESNQKKLQEIQELAAAQPGSVNGMYAVFF